MVSHSLNSYLDQRKYLLKTELIVAEDDINIPFSVSQSTPPSSLLCSEYVKNYEQDGNKLMLNGYLK